MWSSDYPHFEGNAEPIELYGDALDDVDAELRDWFMGGNVEDCFARTGDPLPGSHERMTMRDTAELFDLTGKVVIVTGSTKGIGRAMVEGLARAGASVVVSSRKQDLCDEVAKEVANATGAEVLGLACHVGEWDAIPGFVDGVLERFGRIDGLVNNAGINPARISPAT